MVRQSRLSEPKSQYITFGNDVEIWRTVLDGVLEPLEPRLGAGGCDLAAARAKPAFPFKSNPPPQPQNE